MCKLRDDTMSQAGELPMDFRTNVEKEWEKKMEDRTMFRALDNLSGAAVRGEAVAKDQPHYFLSTLLGGEKFEKEVSIEEWCKAERAAGFRPKLHSGDSAYMTTPATGGFGYGAGISGSIRYFPAAVSPRAADAPSEPSEPEKLDTNQSREYLVKFMEQHFTDKTYHRYIRGEYTKQNSLAGDFAWQMARALRRIEAGVVKSRAADALDSQPTELPEECSDEMYRETTHICNLLEREDVNAMWRAMRKVAIDSRESSAPVFPSAPDGLIGALREASNVLAGQALRREPLADELEGFASMLEAQQEGSEAGK